MRMLPALLAFLVLPLAATSVAAAELPAAVEACRALPDDAKRLACYDGEIDKLVARPPEEKLGYADVRAQEERAASEKDEEKAERLVAKVTAVSKQPNGTHVVTLENGQVWVERNIDYSFRVEVGETVTIKPAAMGSFLMSTASNRATRVRRLK